jgi:ribonuclease BN (tRNA processing enzyme)
MIETNGKIYLVDMGAHVGKKLLDMGKRFEDIKAIFITHPDCDHVDGMPNVLNMTNHRFVKAEYDIFMAREKARNAMQTYVESISNRPMDTNRIRFHDAKVGKIFEDENVRVTFYQTAHLKNNESFSILIEAEGKKLVFTGDMSNLMVADDFPKYALENPTDFILCELAHMELFHIEPYMDRVNTNYFCFNHMNRPIEKHAHVKALIDSKKYPFEIIDTLDDQTIEL